MARMDRRRRRWSAIDTAASVDRHDLDAGVLRLSGAAVQILVTRRGAFGDTLLMAPVLRALGRQWPGAAIVVAGVREYVDVLVLWRVAAAARSSEEFASPAAERRRASLAGFAAVFTDDPMLAATASVPAVCFDPRPRERRALPQQIAEQLQLALDWPADADAGTWRGGGGIALAPGAGGRSKCWPREHWLALAALLAEPLQVVVGPVEQERDDPRTWPWPVAVAFLADLTPSELAQRLTTVAAFVGNDSGPSHLAAMIGVRTIALFGAGEPDVFGPTGRRVVVLQAPGGDLAGLSPAAVAAALARLCCT